MPQQATLLPEMFNTMSLNYPGHGDWYMDTSTTSHLHADVGILKSMSDKIINSSSSILVVKDPQFLSQKSVIPSFLNQILILLYTLKTF